MIRAALISFGVGLLAIAIAGVLGGTMSPDTVRSGLAAWLVIIALPLGALPVLMALELAGFAAMPGTSTLRLLLAILPLAVILGALGLAGAIIAPAPYHLVALYGWRPGSPHDFAAHWFTSTWFGVRAILYLVTWVALSIVFFKPARRPSAGRRQIAAAGLVLHLVVGTLAAIDWTLSLDLGPNASAFGLLLITLQSAFALTVALLIAASSLEKAALRPLSLMTLVAVGAAAFMQFVQYLVVWSANLPLEIVWYQHRLAGFGSTFVIAAPIILIVAIGALMPAGSALRRGPLLVASGLLALLEVADLLWLVTPAWRGSFAIVPVDIVALVAFAGVLTAGALLVSRRTMEVRHG